MHFQHASDLWQDFPQLVPGMIHARGITADVSVDRPVAAFGAAAAERLTGTQESGLPEVQAWRRAFAAMGLKPTQYRCASESLLRRFRKEGSLPRIHPLIDLCNAASIAYGIPVGVFDVPFVSGDLEVRYADGDEVYETFAGAQEHPDPGEVIFADDARRAHARRWTNRQSGYSAVRDTTSEVLIIVEALHESAPADVAKLMDALTAELRAVWGVETTSAVLSRSARRFAV
ncbi:B3/4 domain-containing protein [Streptomyces sp. NPDC127108]|uniref:B3/B4 domain-containing protein n=1 Tax=Streptomyces sp. NPDC127108 TaxID=3345361 RepID=UPI0036379E68